MFTRAQLDELNRKAAKLGGTEWSVTLDPAASEDDDGPGIGVSRR